VTDAELEARRLAPRQVAQPRDEKHHLDRRLERRVARRRYAIDADRHAARIGDLWRHLGARQDAAVARLGSLRKLDLDHLDLRLLALPGNPLGADRAVFVAAAKIAAADLPDQVAAELAMVSADPALAGVVRESAELGPSVEGANGVCAQRAKAHGRDVEERQEIGLAAVGSSDQDAKIMAIDRVGDGRVIDPFEVLAVDVLVRAKRPLVERALGALIRDRAFRPVEGHAVGVALQKILPDLRPDLLEQETDVRQDGIIAPDAVTLLQQVPDADCA